MSFLRKLKALTSQLGEACREKPVIPLCWGIIFITKLFSILFSAFWLLFVVSNVTDSPETIYANIMIVSVVVGMVFVPLAGKLADSVNP
jgi:MFS family permease